MKIRVDVAGHPAATVETSVAVDQVVTDAQRVTCSDDADVPVSSLPPDVAERLALALLDGARRARELESRGRMTCAGSQWDNCCVVPASMARGGTGDLNAP